MVGDGLEQLARFADQHPDAAVVGPRLLNPDGTGAGLPVTFAVAVAMGQAIGRTSTVWGAGEALDIELHQALGGEADHLAQEVGVCRLLQQATEVHGVVGHCRVLGWR